MSDKSGQTPSISPQGDVTRDVFHDAMSRFGSSVAIVTTDGPAGRCGLTVSSLTSVSDAPPLILVCINRNARTCGILTENENFAVSMLSGCDEGLANAFAGRHGASVDERFALTEWYNSTGGSGAPLMGGARVAMDCAVFDMKDVGTHRVVFGHVIGVHFGDDRDTLLYLNRRFHAL